MSTRVLYRGSVKNLHGVFDGGAIVFEYSDAFSVFDWGRMPDPIPGKGAALAVMAASLFTKIERAETWREFSRSAVAQALRKACAVPAAFSELGEELQKNGLRTHFLGLLRSGSEVLSGHAALGDRLLGRDRLSAEPCLAVRAVEVARPATGSVLGRQVQDYAPTRAAPRPKLVPLEVVFRFSCPSGSSLIERVRKDPGYLASIGFNQPLVAGAQWDFPVLEVFTKLEPTDRLLSFGEALGISGLAAADLERVFLSTAWVAGFLKKTFGDLGLELADGKLEWGIDEKGELMLVDAIGPDELRILSPGGTQLSKEFLRAFYRGDGKSGWYATVEKAKSLGRERGVADWKRLMSEAAGLVERGSAEPPALPAREKELATQVYQALANAVTGERVFPSAWPIERVVESLR